jgi:tetratricopeptide (TPR) repeat protein
VQVGYCKVKQGKNSDAIRAYQHALELKPNSEEIHNKLGDAYYYAGRMLDAIASYSRAANIRPDSADAHYNLAIAYFESGNESQALGEAKILRQLDAKLYERYVRETRTER